MILAKTALAAFVLSALLTRAMIPWLKGQGVLANENERTMHQGQVPKGGGLALLIAAVAAAALCGPWFQLDPILLAGAAILALLSWFDDVKPLPVTIRLPVHLGVAALFVLNLPTGALAFQGWLPLVADRIITIIALGWMMNLYNFMDGINGIAGVETIAITCGYLMLGLVTAPHGYEPLAAALLGASAGFLIWNLRTKPLVFLGDAGSVPLGFLMGALMIDLAVKGQWAAAIILPAYFLADATITLLFRLARGEKAWVAHKTHFYQRAAAALGSHLAVVRLIALADVLLVLWAITSSQGEPWFALANALTVLALLLFVFSQLRPSQDLRPRT